MECHTPAKTELQHEIVSEVMLIRKAETYESLKMQSENKEKTKTRRNTTNVETQEKTCQTSQVESRGFPLSWHARMTQPQTRLPIDEAS